MLSEKAYWIILIVAFTEFSLVWFWLVPYRIVEYNLGANLFTGPIFMVLTIVFLSWLFTSGEKNQWSLVEE